jgi:hypothetical protein
MSIFSDMVEKFLEVFMDDFSVFGSSFDNCLHNLALVLKLCKETNLILSWEILYPKEALRWIEQRWS